MVASRPLIGPRLEALMALGPYGPPRPCVVAYAWSSRDAIGACAPTFLPRGRSWVVDWVRWRHCWESSSFVLNKCYCFARWRRRWTSPHGLASVWALVVDLVRLDTTMPGAVTRHCGGGGGSHGQACPLMAGAGAEPTWVALWVLMLRGKKGKEK